MTGRKFPSLLWGMHRPAGEIDPHVFTDVNLDKLLPENTLKVLATPCPAPLILARQYIFSLLCDGIGSSEYSPSGFCAKFEELERVSIDLVQAYDALKTAKNKLETLILFRYYAILFIKFCRLAEMLGEFSDCDLLADFTGYFRGFSNQADKIESSLFAISEAVAKLFRATLTFTPSGTTLDCRSEEEAITQRIFRAAETLGYDIPRRRKSDDIRTEPFYSAAVLARMPEEGKILEDFLLEYTPILDPQIIEYRHELDFYITMRDFYARVKKAGLPLSYPAVSDSPVLKLYDMRDPTLLIKGCEIVPNDAEFDEHESVWFLTGANGGGKTTFLRGVAVNLILALAGAPVIARSGEVWPFEAVYTHFPADETFTGSGRLVEESNRANAILSAAKRGAFVFMNETYSGTDAERGLDLTLRAASILRDKGALGLYVTHFHEVADCDFPMLNTVINADDPSNRTYKIMKSSAIRSSYARDILRKYGLDSESLERRAGVRV